MSKLDSFKASARALARSGFFYGLTPLEFELSFEDGFDEAREWLVLRAAIDDSDFKPSLSEDPSLFSEAASRYRSEFWLGSLPS
jgi:hypothetical protein